MLDKFTVEVRPANLRSGSTTKNIPTGYLQAGQEQSKPHFHLENGSS